MQKTGLVYLISSKKYLNFTFVQAIMHHPLRISFFLILKPRQKLFHCRLIVSLTFPGVSTSDPEVGNDIRHRQGNSLWIQDLIETKWNEIRRICCLAWFNYKCNQNASDGSRVLKCRRMHFTQCRGHIRTPCDVSNVSIER